MKFIFKIKNQIANYSEAKFIALTALMVLVISACSLQGPWEYVVEEQTIYKGIYVSASVIGEESIKSICFEPIYDLDEAKAQNFAFYDSAIVKVIGPFSNGSDTLLLSSTKKYPNCFEGDSSALTSKGSVYSLDAQMWWDSSGVSVKTLISATTKIPDSHEMVNGVANAASLPGAAADMVVLNILIEKYADELLPIMNDSAAIGLFMFEKQDEIAEIIANSPKIEFNDGDTLLYLTGSLNGEGLLFYNQYSDDVKGISLSFYGDSTGGRGETPWQNFGGFISLDTADFASDGYSGASGFVSDVDYPDGSNYMDSSLTFNFNLSKGYNKFYSYAVDSTYYNYYQTAIMGSRNSRVKKLYNIDGAIGYFSGKVKDSIGIYIEFLESASYYPYDIARAMNCSREGASTGADEVSGYWYENWRELHYCESMYQNWCDTTAYEGVDCIGASVQTSLENNQEWNYILDSLNLSYSDKEIEKNKEFGETIYCVTNNFPDGEVCSTYKTECLDADEETDCMKYLWAYCQYRNWDINTYPQCGSAMVSYNLEKKLNSNIWDREVEQYCSANPDVEQCKR